ncbi:MAG: accessory gene regulator B family protein [Wujia sp.]
MKSTQKFVNLLIEEKIISDMESDIYLYCFNYVYDQLSYIIWILFLSIIFGNWKCGLLIILYTVPIRCFGGGFHMPSRLSCQIATTACDLILLMLPSLAPPMQQTVNIVLVIIMLTVILLIGPVIPKEKSLTKEEYTNTYRYLGISILFLSGLYLIILLKHSSILCDTICYTLIIMTILILLGKRKEKHTHNLL